MSFAHGAEAENEPPVAGWRAGLIRVGNDARIEECSRFESVFVHEIGANELPLHWRKGLVRPEGILHLICARLERFQEIAMAPLEVLEHIGKLV